MNRSEIWLKTFLLEITFFILFSVEFSEDHFLSWCSSFFQPFSQKNWVASLFFLAWKLFHFQSCLPIFAQFTFTSDLLPKANYIRYPSKISDLTGKHQSRQHCPGLNYKGYRLQYLLHFMIKYISTKMPVFSWSSLITLLASLSFPERTMVALSFPFVLWV